MKTTLKALKNLKRALSVLLAMAMLCSFAALAAFAEEEPPTLQEQAYAELMKLREIVEGGVYTVEYALPDRATVSAAFAKDNGSTAQETEISILVAMTLFLGMAPPFFEDPGQHLLIKLFIYIFFPAFWLVMGNHIRIAVAADGMKYTVFPDRLWYLWYTGDEFYIDAQYLDLAELSDFALEDVWAENIIIGGKTYLRASLTKAEYAYTYYFRGGELTRIEGYNADWEWFDLDNILSIKPGDTKNLFSTKGMHGSLLSYLLPYIIPLLFSL